MVSVDIKHHVYFDTCLITFVCLSHYRWGPPPPPLPLFLWFVFRPTPPTYQENVYLKERWSLVLRFAGTEGGRAGFWRLSLRSEGFVIRVLFSCVSVQHCFLFCLWVCVYVCMCIHMPARGRFNTKGRVGLTLRGNLTLEGDLTPVTVPAW